MIASRASLSRLLLAGLLTGVSDGLFSSVLSVVFYQSTVERLFQGVAAVPLGREAFNGGTRMVAIGVLLHFGVAFAWSAAFMFLVARSRWVQKILAAPNGILKIAVMSLAVIPLFVHRAPVISVRWWTQFLGHLPFVGMPIVATLGSTGRRAFE